MKEQTSVRIAILASGGGSGFESIADAVAQGKLGVQIAGLICDRPGAPVLEKARARGIQALLVEQEQTPSLDRTERGALHDTRILAALDALPGGRPRFLVLAGYMRILTPLLIRAFRDEKSYSRIVNIHPSLLPAFPGMGGYAQAYAYGTKLAGVTIHLVDEGLDSGPICAQASFSTEHCANASEVESLGKTLEHRLYPEALAWILPEKFKCEIRERLAHQKLERPAQRRISVRQI